MKLSRTLYLYILLVLAPAFALGSPGPFQKYTFKISHCRDSNFSLFDISGSNQSYYIIDGQNTYHTLTGAKVDGETLDKMRLQCEEKTELVLLQAPLSKVQLDVFSMDRDCPLVEKLNSSCDLSSIATHRDFDLQVSAGMFNESERHLGYLRDGKYIGGNRYNRALKGFLVFNPLNEKLPKIDIIEKTQSHWKDLIQQYDTVIENYRLIKDGSASAWSYRNQAHSNLTAIALDKKMENIYLVFIKESEPHILAQVLLSLEPYNITKALYLEGGDHGFLHEKDGPSLGGWQILGPHILGLSNSK